MCHSVSNWGRTTTLSRALIADGPSFVVRWTFIYFTTSWIDSEYLQRAGPAPGKLMCVYMLGRLEEKPATGEMRPRGPVPITNTLAVLLNSPKKRVKNRDKSITFAYGPYHPDAVSLLKVFLNLFLEGEQGRL